MNQELDQEMNNSDQTSGGTYIVAIEGPSGSGKSTLSKHIQASLELCGLKVSIVNVDRFYRNAREGEDKSTRNYDIPDAFDKKLLLETIEQITKKKGVQLPRYSYVLHERLPETDYLEPCDVVVLEGILVYWWVELRRYINLPIYIDVKQEDCLIRRVKRDTRERGRTMDSVFDQYKQTVGPAFEIFIKPQKEIISEVGIVVPKGGNTVNGYNNVIGRIGWDLGLNLGKLKRVLSTDKSCVSEVTE